MYKIFQFQKIELIAFIFLFVFSFVFFYKDTFMFWYCLGAAILSTALAVASYIILRWFYLSLKN